MKGVFELTWKILLILIGGLVAFAIIFLLATGLSSKLMDLFANMDLSSLIEMWKKIGCSFFGGCE